MFDQSMSRGGNTIWNSNYVLCMLVSACSSFAQSMFNPAMPVYGQTIGLGADIIGLITAIALLLCMFGRGISGKLSDMMSKKKLVWIGMLISMAGFLLYFLAFSLPVFFVARVLQTIGNGMVITVLSALSISVVPSKRIPSAIAIFSIASSLAQCFAPNIGTNLAYAGQFKALFITAPVLLLVASFLLSRIDEGPLPKRRKEAAAKAVRPAGAEGGAAAPGKEAAAAAEGGAASSGKVAAAAQVERKAAEAARPAGAEGGAAAPGKAAAAAVKGKAAAVTKAGEAASAMVKAAESTAKGSSVSKWYALIDKILCVPAIPSAILLLFNGVIYTSITNYLSLYGIERDLKGIGIFFTVNAVTMIVSRPLVGKICDSKPLSFIIIPGFIAEVAACALLALTSSMTIVYVAAVCYGLGFGSTQAAIQIMAIRSVGPERRGDANGTFYVGGDIGLAFGAYAAGAIFNAVGSRSMYLFMAAVAVISVIFYVGYQVRTMRRRR